MKLPVTRSIWTVLLMLPLFTLVLPGCFPVVATGMVAGAMSISDRRTTGAQAEDQAIELKTASRLRDRFSSDKAISTSVVSFNRTALITGFAPDAATKLEIGELVAKVENVRQVVNEIQLSGPAGTVTYTQDVYLTTRVKLTLLDHRSINANSIKVVTESSTVYLMGLVTEKEANEVASLTSRVPGVRRVVRAFEIISEDQRKAIDRAVEAGSPPPETRGQNLRP